MKLPSFATLPLVSHVLICGATVCEIYLAEASGTLLREPGPEPEHLPWLRYVRAVVNGTEGDSEAAQSRGMLVMVGHS